jgi:hypothetical protein
LPKVKNATSYFKNGLKNRFRAIAIRADEHFPFLPMSAICIDYEFEIVLIFVIYEQDLL